MLPQSHLLVKVLIFLNVVILIFTYPLTVNPANITLESVTINRWFKGSQSEEGFFKRWAKNFSRLLICISAAYLGIELSKSLDKFIGLLGALFCCPLAIMLPALCHLQVLAKSNAEKVVDIAILGISVLATVFCIV